MAQSPIHSEIDFDAPGKQSGFLRVPHSSHRSAYGWIGVPAASIAQGQGPTILLTAGVHGDEYEGQIALGRLVRDLGPDQVRGRLIVLPALNAPAVEAGLRTSPIDDVNLNRAFPGDPRGTPTEVIAHYVEEVLMPMADYAIDLHSGGSSLEYPAALLRGPGRTTAEQDALDILESAFDLPFAWVFTGGGGPSSTARTLMGAANRKGVVSVMAELGGGGRVSPEILALTERGLRRILHAVGALPDHEPDETRGTRRLNARGSVYAYQSGLFEPFKAIGDPVARMETIGLIHRPDTPWREPDPVTSPFEGLVLCKRAMGLVERGDAVAQIAADAAE